MDRGFNIAIFFLVFLLIAVLLIFPHDLINLPVFIILVAVFGARSNLVDRILYIIVTHVILLFKVKTHILFTYIIAFSDASPSLAS